MRAVLDKQQGEPMENYAETIIPNRAALPQEAYLSELALPFAVITELQIHEKFEKGEKE